MKPFFHFVLFCSLLGWGSFAFAQDALDSGPLPTKAGIVPRIVAPEAIEVGKKIIFDGSFSEYPEGEEIEFSWELGDGNKTQEFPEVVHTYETTGAFTVSLTIRFGEEEVRAEKEVFVFDTRAVLITTASILEENSELIEQAKEEGVYVKAIVVPDESSAVLLEETLLQRIQQERSSLANADQLLFWTPSSFGERAFTRYWQGLEDERKFSLANKLLIRVTETEMNVAITTLQQLFEILRPKSLLLIRPEGINPVFHEKELDPIVDSLENRLVEFEVIDERSRPFPLLILSRMVTGFMIQGIPASTVLLVLSFPFVAFLIAFFHQFIGLSTYGVFLPIVLALSFQVLPVWFALLVLAVILLLSFLLRMVFSKMDILYVPRAALKNSIIVLSFLSLIWFALKFGAPISIPLAIFPMLIMSSISEKFLSAYNEGGLRDAVFGAIETIAVAWGAYLLVDFSFFKEWLLSFPEIIAIPLLGLLFLGKFTGLRLSEYIRFRALLKEGAEE